MRQQGSGHPRRRILAHARIPLAQKKNAMHRDPVPTLRPKTKPAFLRRTVLPLALGAAATAAWAAFSSSISLTSLDGRNGTRSDGLLAGDFLGFSVSSAGDLNGDGIADFALGAPSAGTAAGAVYVVFGVPGGLPFPLDLNTLDGAKGFRIDGATANSQLGSALASGDFNGDGLSDLAIGAPGESAAYLVFGRRTGFAASLGVATLNGSNGFKLQGPANASTGDALSLGDVNGDGIADLAVGNGAANLGMGYVLFGHAGNAPASVLLSGLNGGDGIQLAGAGNNEPNFSVNAAGDVNGDGIGDLLVGSPYASMVYVLFGKPAFANAVVNLTDPQLAARLTGAAGSWFGFAVGGAGDINGDGLRDIVVGAPLAALSAAAPNAGKSYVLLGSRSFPATLDATTLNGGNGGFQVAGAVRNDKSGWSVAGAGDVNADGLDDIVLGAPYSSYAGAAGGASYVIFGKASGFTNLSLAGGLTGSNGFQAVGPTASQSGFSVSAAGDINADGAADLVIGARLASPPSGSNAGSAYLLYGQPPAPPDTTPPSITAQRTPLANAYGWNNVSVTASFVCSDAQSGIQSCTSSIVVGAEGANQSATGTAVDRAGNRATATVTGISIDKTAPTVTVTGASEGAVYLVMPRVRCAATDALSGIATQPTLTLVKGSTVKRVTAYTATCSGASDKADNVAAPVSVHFGIKRLI